MPVSSANGTTAASMLPQLGVVSTVSPSGCSCANRKSRSTPGLLPRRTMPTLLVSGCAPPRPSICRLSGEPIAASSTRSRVATSAGRSAALKNAPRDVPPRMNRQANGGLDGSLLGVDLAPTGAKVCACRAHVEKPACYTSSYADSAWVTNMRASAPGADGPEAARILRQRRRPGRVLPRRARARRRAARDQPAGARPRSRAAPGAAAAQRPRRHADGRGQAAARARPRHPRPGGPGAARRRRDQGRGGGQGRGRAAAHVRAPPHRAVRARVPPGLSAGVAQHRRGPVVHHPGVARGRPRGRGSRLQPDRVAGDRRRGSCSRSPCA